MRASTREPNLNKSITLISPTTFKRIKRLLDWWWSNHFFEDASSDEKLEKSGVRKKLSLLRRINLGINWLTPTA